MSTFGDAERKIAQLMCEGTQFNYNEKEYIVVLSGKPTCLRGEPKTDIYILAESIDDNVEIKISYKKENADFIENKMSAERAEQLFGQEWETIIEHSTRAISSEFEKRILIYTNNFKRTQ